MHVDLNAIGNGGLQERFDREFEKVVKNMKDPNTSYKEARKVTITLTLKQDEDRKTCTCTCDVQSKLAKTKSFDTNFGIGKDLNSGQYIAKEFGTQIPGQLGLDDVAPAADEAQSANLTDFNKKKLSPAMGG